MRASCPRQTWQTVEVGDDPRMQKDAESGDTKGSGSALCRAEQLTGKYSWIFKTLYVRTHVGTLPVHHRVL